MIDKKNAYVNYIKTIEDTLNTDIYLKRSKIRDIVKSNKPSYEYLKEIIYLLREYVKIADVESKKFGEILTPFDQIAKPMVQLVEKYDPDFWKNPNHKVLDSSAGYGTFLILAAYKFMNGLKDWETDPEKRFKWIVENCLYYGEIQTRLVFSWLVTIDPHNKYKTNTYWGDFLSKEFDKYAKEVWKVEKWNAIIQNPPYNLGTSGGNGSRDLWDKFVIKSLSVLDSHGNMVFVHPSKWRSPENEILSEFKKLNLKYLEIHSDSDGSKTFKASTRYDIYLLQNSKYIGKTDIVDETGKKFQINLLDWDWLPNYNYELIESLIDRSDNLLPIYSRSIYGNDKRHMSNKISKDNKLPCIYGMYKDGTFSIRYSSENRGHFGIPKVILGTGRYLYPLIDIEGKYGMMNNAFALPIDNIEEGENIKIAIETPKFRELIKSTKWGNFQTNWKMFKSFRKDFWRDFI